MTDRSASLVSPRPSRPRLPDGYGVPTEGGTMLPWEWARERLEKALGYWVATTRRDGWPHPIPTWGAWLDDRFYCEGSPETVYARNMARDPRVSVHLESIDEVVIVDGVATLLHQIPDDLRERLIPAWAKYSAKSYTPDPAGWPGSLWEIRPTRARGWARLDEFTVWTWDE